MKPIVSEDLFNSVYCLKHSNIALFLRIIYEFNVERYSY